MIQLSLYVRWLIANGREREARILLEQAARVNKVKLTEEALVPDKEKEKEEHSQLPVYGLWDMFRTSQLGITLVLFLCWPVITMLYYGLSLSADKIKMTDNVYLSYALVAVIEIPAFVLVPLVVDVWGRKPVFFLTQLVPGVCCAGNDIKYSPLLLKKFKT